MIRARRWQDMPRRPRHVASEAAAWGSALAVILAATFALVAALHVVAVIIEGVWL